MDRRIKLRHIDCLIQLSVSTHLSDAAREMNVSEASVSKTLAELEAILGQQLVKRNRTRIELLPSAHRYLHFATEASNLLRKGYEEVTTGGDKTQRELRINALPTASSQFLPKVVNEIYRRRLPVNLHIKTSLNNEVYEELHQDRCDIAVGRLGPSEQMANLDFVALYAEPVVWVARKAHPILKAAKKRPIFESIPFLLPPQTASIRRSVELFLASQGLEIPVQVVETVSNAFGRQYIQQSDATWVISKGVVDDLLDLKKVVLITEPLYNVSAQIAVIYRKGPPDPVLQEVVEIMRTLGSTAFKADPQSIR